MARTDQKKTDRGGRVPAYTAETDVPTSSVMPEPDPAAEMPAASMEASPEGEGSTETSVMPPAPPGETMGGRGSTIAGDGGMPALTMTRAERGRGGAVPGIPEGATGMGVPAQGRAVEMPSVKRIQHHLGRGSGIVAAPDFTAAREMDTATRLPEALAAGAAGGADAGPNTTSSDGGGPVLINIHVQLIFWGAAWAAARNPNPSPAAIASSVGTIMNGPYFTGLSQYRGIGRGTLRGTSTFTNTSPPNPFSNNDVVNFITGHIEDGSLPEPDDDSQILYCVVMPRGVSSNQANLIGEHTFFTYTDFDFPFDFDNDNAHYAWLTGGSLDSLTVVFSHEVAESATDPEGNAIQINPRNANAWNEIGDVCNSTGRLNGVLVQSYWSQRDRACIIPNGLPRWTSFGGIINGGLSVPRNADGRLEVFTRGSDGALWHLWQTARNNGWSGWASLGGVITGRNSAIRNADGRLEVFVRGTDGALWHIWQTAPNNGWSGWASLHGVIDDSFVAAQNADGRLEVFARGSDGALWHIWQTAPSNGWSGWASLGGQIRGVVSVANNADGRLEVFVKGTDGALWHIWQTAPSNGWSGWASLGGQILDLLDTRKNADGRLEIFARGTDGALWHKWQTAPNNGWSGWASLGGVINDVLAVASNADGRLEVFARGTDNALWHNWQTAPNNGWSGWATMGGGISDLLAVSNNADGRLEVLVRGFDQALWHVWQTAPSNGWNM